jgi:hypothetical protein
MIRIGGCDLIGGREGFLIYEARRLVSGFGLLEAERTGTYQNEAAMAILRQEKPESGVRKSATSPGASHFSPLFQGFLSAS